jgi:hypothetical protein
MPSPSLSRLYRSDRRRGLALLVTIVLLAFLVLIVAALSSLVRVETQIAVNTDSVAQARQNALVGVNMALGQLQEHAGIDKRVTARSDITSGAIHNSYLTGVWDDSGNLVTWLVNGNEEQTAGNPPYVTPDYATTSKTNAASRILDPTDDSNAENPISSSLVDDSNPPATAAAANPRFGPGHVYLVSGRVDASKTPDENVGSVDVRGNSNAGTQSGYKDGVAERIILRKSPIVVDGGAVPGRAPGSQVQIGSYAYWVADNGIRASLGSGNRAATGLNVFAGAATDLLNYDDSGATPAGMDYNQRDNAGFSEATAASDESYLARKFLNSLQLQSTRADLVLRDNSANDIFNATNPVDLRDFYAFLAHPDNSPFFSELSSIDQLTQLPVLRDYNAAGVTPSLSNVPAADIADYQNAIRDRLRQRFHDITPKSRGVLTDMVNGGLRKDLTFEAANAFPNTAATFQPGVKTFLDFWRSGAATPLANTASGRLGLSSDIVAPPAAAFAAPANTAYFPVVPVTSEFKFLMNLSVDASGGVQVTTNGSLELWNPYNVILKVPAGQTLYAVIRVSGSTTHLSDFSVSDGITPPQFVNFEKTFGGIPIPNHEVCIFFPLTTSGPQEWNPGEVKVWDFTLASRPAKDSSDSNIVGMTVGASLEVTQSATSRLNVAIHMGNNPPPAASPLFSARDIEYQTPPGPGLDLHCYYFRLSDYQDYDANSQNWLANSNPLGPVLRDAMVGSVPVFQTTPTNQDTAFDSVNQILNNAALGAPTFVVLYDVPRQEITSIGSLQHLAFSPSGGSSNSRAYRLGGPGSGGINVLFDTHFISTVPRDAAMDIANPPADSWLPVLNRPLANTALRVFDPAAAQNTPHEDLMNVVVGGVTTGLQSERAAEFLLIEDAFNINSTSVSAWMGVLGGALPSLADPNVAAPDGDDYVWPTPATADSELKANWRYRNGGSVETVPLANVFFRLPHTATYLDGNYVSRRDDLDNGTSATRVGAAFLLGLREFSKGQIEALATAVVARLKTNGKPFTSLSAFVDSGVLDGAIQDAALNTTPSGHDIPPLSPAFLTQGDILQLIAPRLVARSDTFTVRSYGDVVDPVTGEVRARAWVEATIQRLPVKHRSAANPADNMAPTGGGAGNFGRQFKVVGLRWLSPDEI